MLRSHVAFTALFTLCAGLFINNTLENRAFAGHTPQQVIDTVLSTGKAPFIDITIGDSKAEVEKVLTEENFYKSLDLYHDSYKNKATRLISIHYLDNIVSDFYDCKRSKVAKGKAPFIDIAVGDNIIKAEKVLAEQSTYNSEHGSVYENKNNDTWISIDYCNNVVNCIRMTSSRLKSVFKVKNGVPNGYYWEHTIYALPEEEEIDPIGNEYSYKKNHNNFSNYVRISYIRDCFHVLSIQRKAHQK